MRRFHAIAIPVEACAAAVSGPFGKSHAALAVLNFVSAMAFLSHVAYVLSEIAYEKVVRRVSVLFVCGSQLKRLIWGASFLASSSAYHYAAFRGAVCDVETPTCSNIDKAFRIGWILLIATIAMQTCIVAAFFWTFATQRLTLWKEILELEDALIFNEEIKSQCSVVCRLTDYYNAKDFLDYWTSLSRDEILESLPSKASSVYEVFSNRTGVGALSLADFKAFATREGIVDCERLWKLFSDGEHITVDRIYDALYDLSFDRQRFANMIKTDFRVIRWIFLYMASVVYAACFVFVARILDYQDAFGEGVDLFKVYILAISYLAANCGGRIVFLHLMLSQRPFDIGDLLRIDGEAYVVSDFDPGFTYLCGPTYLMISNSDLLSRPVVNLTRSNVYDSVELSLPANFPGEWSFAAQSALEAYARENERSIDSSSVRCGWSRCAIEGFKVFQANWRYKCSITDRANYLWTRTRLIDHLVRFSSDEIGRRSLSHQAAAGGAYNALAKYD